MEAAFDKPLSTAAKLSSDGGSQARKKASEVTDAPTGPRLAREAARRPAFSQALLPAAGHPGWQPASEAVAQSGQPGQPGQPEGAAGAPTEAGSWQLVAGSLAAWQPYSLAAWWLVS